MGFINYTGLSKAFTGEPFTVLDTNSIQAAVAGTLTNQASATKNMITLATVSHLDMFAPKRTAPPNSTSGFRGYPKLTFNYTLISKTVYPDAQSSTGYKGTLSFSLNSNNRFVGFPYRIFIQVFSGTSFTPPEPDNPGGASGDYFETTIDVGTGGTFNQTFNLLLTDVDFSALSNTTTYSINIYYTQSVGGQPYVSSNFYLFNGTEDLDSNVVRSLEEVVSPQANQNPYQFAFTFTPISAFDCLASQTGAPITVWSESPNLSIGSIISLSTSQMVAFTGDYEWFSNSDRYVVVIRQNFTTGNSFVNNLQLCSTGGGSQQ